MYHVVEGRPGSMDNQVWLFSQNFVGRKIGGSSISDLELDCEACAVGHAATVKCKDGTKSGDTKKDCSKLKTKADCTKKEDRAQCCVCGGGVKDYNPPAQTSCETCVSVSFHCWWCAKHMAAAIALFADCIMSAQVCARKICRCRHGRFP